MVLTLAAVVLAVATYRTSHGYLLPDAAATPGVVATTDRRELCSTKWGRDARAVTVAMKRAACEAYGLKCPLPRRAGKPGTQCSGDPAICADGVEIDHLCSRENCGRADDVRNLWPQPWKEARAKDVVENRLHRAICSGEMAPADAQKILTTDWTTGLDGPVSAGAGSAAGK